MLVYCEVPYPASLKEINQGTTIYKSNKSHLQHDYVCHDVFVTLRIH